MKSVLFLYCIVAFVTLFSGFDVGDGVTYAVLDWVVGAGSVLGSLASGLFGSSAQKSANETNIQIARENRDWQSGQNQLNRVWQEKMWNLENLYNTPSAMRKRLEDAGYNPNALFSDMSAQRGANVGSPSMVGAPNGVQVQPVNPMSGLSGLGSALQLGLQSKLLDSESSNQSAQAQATLIKALSQAYQELGKDGFYEFAKRVQPYMLSVNPDKSFWSERMKSEIYNLDMDSLNKELQFELSKKFTPEQIHTSIQEANYRISEIVGRLNSMNVQNQALVDKTAAEVVRAMADAFKLRKEGEKYIADTQTANALRGALKRIYDSNASVAEDTATRSDYLLGSESDWLKWLNSSEGRSTLKESKRIPLKRKSDAIWTSVDKLFGDYIKVMGSPAGGSEVNTTEYYPRVP